MCSVCFVVSAGAYALAAVSGTLDGPEPATFADDSQLDMK